MVAKEVFQGLALMWHARRPTIPAAWRHVCRTSIFACLAPLGNRDRWQELVLHEDTARDMVQDLLFDGVCEELLSLPLGLYYLLEVTDVGLSATDVLSLLLSGVTIAVRLIDLCGSKWKVTARGSGSATEPVSLSVIGSRPMETLDKEPDLLSADCVSDG